MASISYEKKRTDPEAVAVWTVHLRFPVFELLAEKNWYWATSGDSYGIQLADGNTYVRQLATIPRGRHQRDRGNDYAEFSVANPDNDIYNEFLPYEDLCERGEVVICECYEIVPEVFEEEIRFVGNIKDFTLDETDNTLRFTCYADTSRSGFLVGNRILTRDRCGTAFNINGVNPPETHVCGWQTEQGGNPLFCSKLYEGVDGCLAHNNGHRFYAVPALTTATVEVIDPGTIGGPGGDTGFDYETQKPSKPEIFYY